MMRATLSGHIALLLIAVLTSSVVYWSGPIYNGRVSTETRGLHFIETSVRILEIDHIYHFILWFCEFVYGQRFRGSELNVVNCRCSSNVCF